jgi:hypothetical protein
MPSHQDRIRDANGKDDKGHTELINDLSNLLSEVITYEFHDFKNTKYATPKFELYNKLNNLISRLKKGDYDS